MTRKTNYFYIDESGSINNNSNIFILGCIKTENPQSLLDNILAIEKFIKEDLYYEGERIKFNKNGFHAVENHPDIRTQLYRILPLLNYRSYFVYLNKKNEYFQNLLHTYKSYQIYKLCVKHLLSDRLKKAKGDNNVLIFEELTFEDYSLDKLVKEFLEEIKMDNIEYKIVSKSEKNLSLIDYLNYIFYCILNEPAKKQERMIQNFELIKPKIGSIKYINERKYFSRFENYNLEQLIKTMTG